MPGIREAIRKHLPAPKEILGHAAGGLVGKALWPAVPFLVAGGLSFVRGIDSGWIVFLVGMTAGMLLNVGIGKAFRRQIRYWRYAKLLEELLDETAGLKYGDWVAVDALRKRGTVVLERIFGNDSPYLAELQGMRFARPYGLTHDAEGDWEMGRGKCANLFRALLEGLKLP